MFSALDADLSLCHPPLNPKTPGSSGLRCLALLWLSPFVGVWVLTPHHSDSQIVEEPQSCSSEMDLKPLSTELTL